jgi:hypothetical protein
VIKAGGTNVGEGDVNDIYWVLGGEGEEREQGSERGRDRETETDRDRQKVTDKHVW